MKTRCLVLAAGLTLAGATVAQAAEKLVIISPHWEGIRVEYEQAFSDWYKARTGQTVDIQWLDVGGTSDILRYLRSQYQKNPATAGVDILWGGGVDPYIALANDGLLAPYRLPADLLNQIPDNIFGVPMYDEQYRWYGSALSGFGIIYNKAVLKRLGLPEPKTWADLANPAYYNWVGSVDLRHSGAAHMVYEIIFQAYGWEKGYDLITRMLGNTRTVDRSSSDVPRAVAAGDLALGMSIDFYAWEQVAEKGADRIGFVLPEGLTVVNPDSIAILKGAPNADVAQAFLRFVLSKEGQRLWMLPKGAPGGPKQYSLGRLSVLPSLYRELGDRSIVPLNPFALKNLLRYDAEKGSLRWNVINDLIGSTLIDPHANLKRVWKRIADAGLDRVAVEALTEVPVSEQEALNLAKQWNDQALRNRTIAAWSARAIAQQAKAQQLAR